MDGLIVSAHISGGPPDTFACGANERDNRSEDRPRVALVSYNIADDNGTGRVWAELLRHAAAHFEFTVVSSVLDDSLHRFVSDWVQVRVPERPFPLRLAAFWMCAARRVRSLEVDLVHTSGAIIPNRVDIAAIHLCHAGFVAALRRPAAPGTSPLRLMNAAIGRALAIAAEQWCYRPGRLRAFSAVSTGVGDEVSRHYPGVVMHVTPNGVDHDRFRRDPDMRRQVRGETATGDAPVAVFVGGWWDHKGLRIALESLARAREAGVDLRLWVVGAGDQARFSKMAHELGVASAVTFFGPRKDVERFLAAADMFVLPSSYEAHPLVALEAAACGLPVVATRVHGIVDLLADGDAGIQVDRSAESVGDALVRLARDRELRQRLGRGAMERSARYTWKASAESVMALYRSLLAERQEATV